MKDGTKIEDFRVQKTSTLRMEEKERDGRHVTSQTQVEALLGGLRGRLQPFNTTTDP